MKTKQQDEQVVSEAAVMKQTNGRDQADRGAHVVPTRGSPTGDASPGFAPQPRGKTMKILRIPLVIVLLVVAGRVFDAEAQTETNLHSFVGYPSDGWDPQAGLVQGSDGNFYGTTVAGGTSTNCTFGCGTVFRISPSGSYTTLYSFVGSPTDGRSPHAGLVQGSNGNFYGTTYYAGSGPCFDGCGTVFRISPSGTETNL